MMRQIRHLRIAAAIDATCFAYCHLIFCYAITPLLPLLSCLSPCATPPLLMLAAAYIFAAIAIISWFRRCHYYWCQRMPPLRLRHAFILIAFAPLYFSPWWRYFAWLRRWYYIIERYIFHSFQIAFSPLRHYYAYALFIAATPFSMPSWCHAIFIRHSYWLRILLRHILYESRLSISLFCW